MKRIPEVGSVMTAVPHAIAHDVPIGAAEKTMEELGVRHLPVLYGKRFLGVLSDRDVKIAHALEREGAATAVAGDLCVQDCYIVSPETPLDEVVTHMSRERIGSAIIAEDSQLLGILTSTDVCRIFGDFLRSMALTAGS